MESKTERATKARDGREQEYVERGYTENEQENRSSQGVDRCWARGTGGGHRGKSTCVRSRAYGGTPPGRRDGGREGKNDDFTAGRTGRRSGTVGTTEQRQPQSGTGQRPQRPLRACTRGYVLRAEARLTSTAGRPTHAQPTRRGARACCVTAPSPACAGRGSPSAHARRGKAAAAFVWLKGKGSAAAGLGRAQKSHQRWRGSCTHPPPPTRRVGMGKRQSIPRVQVAVQAPSINKCLRDQAPLPHSYWNLLSSNLTVPREQGHRIQPHDGGFHSCVYVQYACVFIVQYYDETKCTRALLRSGAPGGRGSATAG